MGGHRRQPTPDEARLLLAWVSTCMTAMLDQIATGHSAAGIQVERISSICIPTDSKPRAVASRRLKTQFILDTRMMKQSHAKVVAIADAKVLPLTICSAKPPKREVPRTSQTSPEESGIDLQSPRKLRSLQQCHATDAISPDCSFRMLVTLRTIRKFPVTWGGRRNLP